MFKLTPGMTTSTVAQRASLETEREATGEPLSIQGMTDAFLGDSIGRVDPVLAVVYGCACISYYSLKLEGGFRGGSHSFKLQYHLYWLSKGSSLHD